MGSHCSCCSITVEHWQSFQYRKTVPLPCPPKNGSMVYLPSEWMSRGDPGSTCALAGGLATWSKALPRKILGCVYLGYIPWSSGSWHLLSFRKLVWYNQHPHLAHWSRGLCAQVWVMCSSEQQEVVYALHFWKVIRHRQVKNRKWNQLIVTSVSTNVPKFRVVYLDTAVNAGRTLAPSWGLQLLSSALVPGAWHQKAAQERIHSPESISCVTFWWVFVGSSLGFRKYLLTAPQQRQRCLGLTDFTV